MSAFNKNHDRYYYETFLGKCSYKLYKKLYYDRVDVSEGIDVNKTSVSKECFFELFPIIEFF